MCRRYTPDAPSPEHPVGPGWPVAEPERRVVARIIDTLIVGIPVGTVGRLLGPDSAGTLGGWVLVAFAVLSFAYELPQLVIWGQTLGKRFAGIRVVDAAGDAGPAGGSRVPAGRILVRTGIYTVPLALRPVPVLGLIAAVFWLADCAWLLERPHRQALHDRAARTAVVVIR
jgi:uncharacterized RDD family membrane protein YckC